MNLLARLSAALRRASSRTPEATAELERQRFEAYAAHQNDSTGPIVAQRRALDDAWKYYQTLPVGDAPPIEGLDLLNDAQLATWPPRLELVNGIMREGEVAILVGPPKTKKTWIGLDLAHCLASAGDWMGLFTCGRPQRVLAVDCECEPSEIWRRVQAVRNAGAQVGRYRHLDPDRLRYVALRGARQSRALADRLERLEWTIVDAAAGVTIIDTASAAFPIQDENDNAEISALMGELLNIATRTESAIVLVHHTPKMPNGRATVDMAAGAGAWTRRADTVIGLTIDGEGATRLSLRARSVQTTGPYLVNWPAELRGVLPVAVEAPDDD